jgi:3-hydroxybutyryl-CoA dehydratase
VPTLTSIPYDALTEGQTDAMTREVTEEDLQRFAVVSGDNNPLHLDEEFAAGTEFGGRIAHGMFAGALISAALATRLPGPGTVYLSQNLAFRRPVRIGDTLTVRLEVAEKRRRGRVLIHCQVLNQDDVEVVRGEAEVIAPAQAVTVEAPELGQLSGV